MRTPYLPVDVDNYIRHDVMVSDGEVEYLVEVRRSENYIIIERTFSAKTMTMTVESARKLAFILNEMVGN